MAILGGIFEAHIASCLAFRQRLFAVYILVHVIQNLHIVFLRIQPVTARATTR